MPQTTPDSRDFTHLSWQHGASSKATEEDHLVLHVDQPAPSGTPEFHEVEDAAMPSPDYVWPVDDEHFTIEEPSMIVFEDKDADQSASKSIFS